MLTKQQKDFVLQVWKKVMPGGATLEEVERNIAEIRAIQHELEALPVEVPVDVEPGVSPELVKAVEWKRKRH
jgi:hypothetical protein